MWFGRGSGEGEEDGWSLDRPRVADVLSSPLAVLAAIALLARSTLREVTIISMENDNSKNSQTSHMQIF